MTGKSEKWDILFTKSYTDGAVQGELLDTWRNADAVIHQGPLVTYRLFPSAEILISK